MFSIPHTILRRASLVSALTFVVMTIPIFLLPNDAVAQRAGGRGGGGTAATRPAPSTRPAPTTRPSNNVQGSRTNIYAPQRGDINIDRDVDIDIDDDDHWGWGGDWDDGDDFGAGVVAGLFIGAIVTSIPPSCTPVVVSGVTYQSCNGVLYQPVYQGTTVQYQVVQVP